MGTTLLSNGPTFIMCMRDYILNHTRNSSMKKIVLGIALAVGFSTAAYAKDIKPEFAFVSDTEYNVTQETTNTEFGVTAGIKGLDLSLLPNWNWDDQEISNIEVSAGYTFDVTDRISVTPYGELNFDNDLEAGDRIIGVKTKMKF